MLKKFQITSLKSAKAAPNKLKLNLKFCAKIGTFGSQKPAFCLIKLGPSISGTVSDFLEPLDRARGNGRLSV